MFCDNLSTYIMVTVSCHSLMKCKENLSFIKLYLDGIVCPDLRRGKLQSNIMVNRCNRTRGHNTLMNSYDITYLIYMQNTGSFFHSYMSFWSTANEYLTTHGKI